MPAEHQRVFLYRGKGPPDAREFSLSRKSPPDARGRSPEGFFFTVEKPYQDQSAGGARKRHVFCAACPYRPTGPAYIFQAATAGSIIVKRRFSSSSSIIR